MLKAILGIGMLLSGIVLGLAVGVYFMLYGGIVQFIEGVQNGWIAKDIALGIVRVFLAPLAGWLSAIVLIVPGWFLITEGK